MNTFNSIILTVAAVILVGCGDFNSVEGQVSGIDQQSYAVTFSGEPHLVDHRAELLNHPDGRVIQLDSFLESNRADQLSCQAVTCPAGTQCQSGLCRLDFNHGVAVEHEDFEVDIDPMDDLIDSEAIEQQLTFVILPR